MIEMLKRWTKTRWIVLIASAIVFSILEAILGIPNWLGLIIFVLYDILALDKIVDYFEKKVKEISKDKSQDKSQE